MWSGAANSAASPGSSGDDERSEGVYETLDQGAFGTYADTTGTYVDDRQLWRVLTTAARDAGLARHVHPHLLRHTFASHCYMRGVPPQIVQQWLGHAHITTTERYAHLAPNAGEELIDRVAPTLRMFRGNTTTHTKVPPDRRTPFNGV